MVMEVVIPSSLQLQRMDLEFNNAIGSSFLSAPSSPTGFGDCVFSAPTSPARISEFYKEFNSHRQGSRRSNCVSVPFDWEVRPGTPKSPKSEEEEEEEDEDVDLGFDFAFDISQDSDTASLSAEELFDGGKIRPLKPPPRLQIEEQSSPRFQLSSPRSPKSPLSQGKKIIREALSPRRRNQIDPFEAAIENTRNNNRGRDMLKNPSRRTARSLSPYRVSAYPWEEEEKHQQQLRHHQVQDNTNQQPPPASSSSSTASPPAVNSSKSSSRKWRLRDFLLFRSSSEGRATDQKDPLRKYSAAQFRRPAEEVKNESFRLNRRKVTAHEKLYATNKAAADDLKKRTFLPYKQGLLGRLAFSPTAYAFTRP